MKKLSLLLSALALVLATTLFVSCGDDDPSEAPTETIFPPTDGIMARAMLIAHQWTVPLADLQQWYTYHDLDYESYLPEIDDARFGMMNDHCFLAIHVKNDATTHESDRGKWLIAYSYESDESSDYNLRPESGNPAQGIIYEDDNGQRLEYRQLTNRTMQLIVVHNVESFVINLTARLIE